MLRFCELHVVCFHDIWIFIGFSNSKSPWCDDDDVVVVVVAVVVVVVVYYTHMKVISEFGSYKKWCHTQVPQEVFPQPCAVQIRSKATGRMSRQLACHAKRWKISSEHVKKLNGTFHTLWTYLTASNVHIVYTYTYNLRIFTIYTPSETRSNFWYLYLRKARIATVTALRCTTLASWACQTTSRSLRRSSKHKSRKIL